MTGPRLLLILTENWTMRPAPDVGDLVSFAVEAEREVVNIVVATDYQELVTNAIFHAGGLGKPVGGYLYVTALEKVATYIPEAAMARLQAAD